MKSLSLLGVLFVLLAVSAGAQAADGAATLDVEHEPHIRVPQIAGPLVIDGDLSKPEWQQAAVIKDLVEDTPTPLGANPYHTEVRLLRDADHLYVAVHAVDPDPEHIQTHTLARDGNQDSDDHMSIVLDTFRDHRYAYVFRINSAGAREDGLLSVGSTSVDFSWDGIWDAKSRRTPEGWDLEIAFDTHSFQFDPASDQWGFNILRYMRRNDYGLVWFARPLAGSVFDLKHEGVIEGMAGLQQGNGWQISPYVLARSDQLNPASKRFEIGGEVKYNLTPQLAATLTVNTDFAQTEADSQQLNLTRFPLFFPEKRAFFLDGQSLFAFNGGPLNGDLNGGFIPYYSRTVGLANGETVPIDEGAKLIGRVGNLSMGVLDVNTGSVPGVPTANLGVARFAYNATDHWQFGTLFTKGDPAGVGHASFTGFDSAWQTSTFLGDQNLGATAWAGDTGSTQQGGQSKGWGFDVNYPNVFWSWEAQLNVFGDAFDPSLGFLPRPGTRQYYENVSWYPRPASNDNPWLENYVFGESYNQISGLDGRTQSSKLILTPFGTYGFNGNYLNLHLTREYESLSAPFQVDPNVAIPVGNYSFDGYRLEWDTPTASTTTAILVLSGGQFYGGHALNDSVQFNWYALDGKLSMLLFYQGVYAHLPQGHFVQRLWQFNGTYSFTTDFSISSFVQYDTTADQLGFNTRLHWVIADDKDLYLVWNRNWRQAVTNTTPDVPDVADSVIVKLAWNFKE
ncbi:MAG TPA: DUF5916 domain-containing protein [Gammaproteobacteria bacterium]|nr:DUF5916 domain-containing protein [Gammaproteobacteria bacterium]